ncbi:MAG: insulinase family protein [Sandaracinaceae bacterium]
MRAASLAVLLLAACTHRAPLPPPASARSGVPPLPVPAQPVAEPALRLPSIHAFTLENGISVQVVERRGTPVVYAALAGRVPHVPGTPRAVALDALLERALGAELPSGFGAMEEGEGLRTSVDERGLTLVSTVVTDGVPGALSRFASVLEGRVFGDGEVRRAQQALAGDARHRLRRRRRRGYAPPNEELLARLYGPDDPRVLRTRIGPLALERLGDADVRQRLAELLPPSRTMVVLVGDLDPLRAEALVRQRLGPVRPRSVARALRPAPAPVFPAPSPRLMIYPTSDHPSASIYLLDRGPARHHRDHAAYRLYVRMAGGMFSSRLNLHLREQRGDTYGVIGQVHDRGDHALFQLGLVVPVEVAGDAASAIVRELDRLRDADRIGEEEMERARAVELARLSSTLDTAAGLGGALVGAHLAGQPPGAIVDTYHRVERATPAEVAEAGRRWIRPEHAPMQIIGDYLWLSTHPVRVPGRVSFIHE